MSPAEELLTQKAFTRERALSLLEEFSRTRIAEWLAGEGQRDAVPLAELVEPLDSLLLAFSKFRVLVYPFGLRTEWDLEQEKFFHEGSVPAFLANLRPELIAAHAIGSRTSKPKAIAALQLAFSGWAHALRGWPKKGFYFDRQQVLALIYDAISPGPRDAKPAFRAAAARLLEQGGDKIDADEFFWEFMSANKMTRSLRYFVRRPNGWSYEPIQLAGIVKRQADKGKKDLVLVDPDDLKKRPVGKAESAASEILETIKTYRAARLARTRSAAERAVLENLEGLLLGELTETDVSQRTDADQSNVSKALQKARADLQRLAR